MSVLQLLLGGAETDFGFGLLPPALPSGNAGDSVALSDDPTTVPLTVVVGATGYLDGAVFVYQWDAPSSSYIFLTTVSSPASGIDFGFSVALSGNATVLAVGAPDDQGDGRVHMYTWNGTVYVADEILDPNPGGLGPGAGARTGESVALSDAGTAVLASSPHANTDSRGWGYSWHKSGTWSLVAQRIGKTSPFQANGHCSESMGLSADGLTAVLLQPGGAYVRIFERASVSVVFAEVFTLQVATIGGLKAVTITDDAKLVFLTDPPSGASTGGVRSYANAGGGSWVARSFVAAPGGAGSKFGSVIVARNDDMFIGEGFGAFLHEFTYDSSGVPSAGTMVFVASTLPPDSAGNNGYGSALALVFPAGTSRVLAIGEPFRDRLGFINAGNAYAEVTSWP